MYEPDIGRDEQREINHKPERALCSADGAFAIFEAVHTVRII